MLKNEPFLKAIHITGANIGIPKVAITIIILCFPEWFELYTSFFPRLHGLSDPDMHHGTCVTHVPWCMPGSLTGGFLWSRWRRNRSRHSRRMRNPQFYASGKRPMLYVIWHWCGYTQTQSIAHVLGNVLLCCWMSFFLFSSLILYLIMCFRLMTSGAEHWWCCYV